MNSKALFHEYRREITIIVLGCLLAIVMYFMPIEIITNIPSEIIKKLPDEVVENLHNKNSIKSSITRIDLLILVITLSVAIVSITIRKIEKSIKETIIENQKVANKFTSLQDCFNTVNPRWKDHFNSELDEFITRMKYLSEGTRKVVAEDLIKHQVKLIKNVKKTIDAIHLTFNEEDLRRWIPNSTQDFNILLVNANKDIKKMVRKRRIFIVNENLFDIPNCKELWVQVMNLQFDTLKFEVGVISNSTLEKERIEMPSGLLICDNEELLEINTRNTITREGEACLIEKKNKC